MKTHEREKKKKRAGNEARTSLQSMGSAGVKDTRQRPILIS